jgi:hypothetical protein
VAALLSDLRQLSVEIAQVACERRDLSLTSYPDGPRPSSTVRLDGALRSGRGEHVGWTPEAHQRFAARVSDSSLRGSWTVGQLSDRLRDAFSEPYDRAAIEAAAVALALAQNDTGLGGILGVEPAPVRYVVSFDAASDPSPKMREELRSCPTREFKLDVDPEWEDDQLERIADAGEIAILDFKGRGSAVDHLRFARRFPDALLEDALAWETLASPKMRSRSSVDAPLVSAEEVRRLDPPPAAVNVKPARMGGVLQAIEAIAHARERGLEVYFGGMFEVGVGRRQLQSLASLLCPDGPNDVAPLHPPERPARLVPPRGDFLR